MNAALSAAGPGDTILLTPGFYQEIVLVEKPVKLLGQPVQDIRGHDRRGVVIQTNRSMCILSNARHALFHHTRECGMQILASNGAACTLE